MLTLNEQRNLCLRFIYMIQQGPYSFKLFLFWSKLGPRSSSLAQGIPVPKPPQVSPSLNDERFVPTMAILGQQVVRRHGPPSARRVELAV
jgi:hypothetical protein